MDGWMGRGQGASGPDWAQKFNGANDVSYCARPFQKFGDFCAKIVRLVHFDALFCSL